MVAVSGCGRAIDGSEVSSESTVELSTPGSTSVSDKTGDSDDQIEPSSPGSLDLPNIPQEPQEPPEIGLPQTPGTGGGPTGESGSRPRFGIGLDHFER